VNLSDEKKVAVRSI